MAAPLLQQTLPSDNATGISVTSNIGLGFDQAVKAGSGYIRIYKADGTLFHTIAITDTSQVTFSTTQPARVMINPNVDLVAGTGYYILIDAGAIENIGGEDYAGISSSTTLNFTTSGSAPGDTTAPLLTLTSPADNATNVAVGANLVLTFNEAVKAGTGNIEIHKVSDASLAMSVAVTDAAQIAFSGNQLTINPTADLALGTGYYVTFASGVVLDVANNAFGGIASSTTLNFTTVSAPDATAPLLTDTSPDDDATGVAVGANLVLTFNEAVKAGAGSIYVRKVSDGSLIKTFSITDASRVSISGNQVTIDPSTDFAPGVQYYVTFGSGVILDLANNPFEGISSTTAFTFTTAGMIDETAPQLISTSPAYNMSDVDPSANLVFTFNEAIKLGGGTVFIYDALTNAVVQTIATSDPSLFNVSGNQLTVNPPADLALGTAYYVIVTSALVRDFSDNNFAGVASPSTIYFTTAAPPPPPPPTTILAKSGSQFLVNTTTEGQQHGPSVSALTNGKFVVVWTDFSASIDDPGGSSRGQIFNANGSKFGSEFLVNTNTNGVQAAPVVAALSDGRFVVTWTSINGQDIQGQLFAADGSKLGSEFPVSGAGSQLNPTITELDGGGFVVAWTEFSFSGDDTSGYSIQAQIFDADGNKIGSQFLVNTSVVGSQNFPAIDGLAGGGFVVAWTDQNTSSTRVQRYDQAGNQVGTEIFVSASSMQDGPEVVGLTDGGFVVLWKVLGSSAASMYGQLFDASGDALGQSFLVSSHVVSDAGTPRFDVVDNLQDGRFVVTWTYATADSDVHAQIFNTDGTKFGAEVVVNTTVAGGQFSPSLAVLADGKVVFAWSDASQSSGDTSDLAIGAQLFSLVEQPGLVLTGNAQSNTLIGGAGNDTIKGLGRGDTLTGGAGIDKFVYTAASESTSTNRDTITDFNASTDLFDLWFEVTGVDTSITSGSLGTRRFDSDLASAVSAAKLAAHHAVLFTPSTGALSGSTFLIVDANGVAGYQASADVVILLGSASSLTGLTAADFV